MLEKIRDIQKALAAKAYLSALALALTLPDICGKIAYPGLRTGERYIAWFDEYVTKNMYPQKYPDVQKFDGKKIYKLRCAFLHEGSIEGVPDVVTFTLLVMESPEFGMSSCTVTRLPDGSCTFQVNLDVMQICTEICLRAENFYNAYEEKSAFDDQSVVTITANAEKYF